MHSIIEDNHKRLWISTNRLLNCFDKRNNNIYTFSEKDGISSSEFNRFSFFNDTTNNRIYFGGLNGYTHFNPDSIIIANQENSISTRIIKATKTKNNGAIESISESLIKRNTIEMLEDDLTIALNLSTNHIVNSRNKTYSYKISGIYDNWINIKNNNTINLSRLPYGQYTMEIVSNRNRHSSTSKPLSIDLNVIKPFTKTYPFYFFTLICSGLFIWLLLRKYSQNTIEKNNRLEKIINERTLELRELNDTKNKIFTILAHDLKAPIMSMTDISEKIKFLLKKNRIDEIDILADQTKTKINALNDNLNNILSWAISEDTIDTQDKQMYSLHLEIKKILDLYSNLIRRKKITTNIHIDVIDQVYLNITVLQTMLRNYIHNAITESMI